MKELRSQPTIGMNFTISILDEKVDTEIYSVISLIENFTKESKLNYSVKRLGSCFL